MKGFFIIIGVLFPLTCSAQIGPQLYLENFTLIKNNTKQYIDTVSNESTFNKFSSEISISFKNVGDEPLIISQVQGSDPCFAFSKSTFPIAPGETGFIRIRCPVRPDYRASTFFTIYSNGNSESDAKFSVMRWYKEK